MNTYGLFSINIDTFNLNKYSNLYYPKEIRDLLVTFLKIHNLILNIFGYISQCSPISGCIRMGTGIMMCSVTLAFGERRATNGMIIGRWYDEALLTGITQIARGALEAFASFGWKANVSLSAIGTILSLGKAFSTAIEHDSKFNFKGCRPHRPPVYPFPFNLLHII